MAERLWIRLKGYETTWPVNTIDYGRGIVTYYDFGVLVTLKLDKVDIVF